MAWKCVEIEVDVSEHIDELGVGDIKEWLTSYASVKEIGEIKRLVNQEEPMADIRPDNDYHESLVALCRELELFGVNSFLRAFAYEMRKLGLIDAPITEQVVGIYLGGGE